MGLFKGPKAMRNKKAQVEEVSSHSEKICKKLKLATQRASAAALAS